MGFTISRARVWLTNSHFGVVHRALSLHRGRARAIVAFRSRMCVLCLFEFGVFIRAFLLHRRRARAILAFHSGMCFLSKSYALSMFHVQATKWTQVAPKSSQDSPKMAPNLPIIAKRWTQVAPKSSQDSPKMGRPCPALSP